MPDEPPTTPNMYTDAQHYDYSEIPDRLCETDCCNHSLDGNCTDRKSAGLQSDKSHQISPLSENNAMTINQNCKEMNGNFTRSYAGCRKTMFVGGCKSCAEKEILHL